MPWRMTPNGAGKPDLGEGRLAYPIQRRQPGINGGGYAPVRRFRPIGRSERGSQKPNVVRRERDVNQSRMPPDLQWQIRGARHSSHIPALRQIRHAPIATADATARAIACSK